MKEIPAALQKLQASGDLQNLPSDVPLFQIDSDGQVGSGASDQLVELSGRMLASGELRSAMIIMETGDFLSVPPKLWRKTGPGTAFLLGAISLGKVEHPPPSATGMEGIPVVAEIELGRAFGAQILPPPPYALPDTLDATTASAEPESQSRAAVGGRPNIYDWEPFLIELVHYAAANDLDDRTAVQRHMEAWSEKHWEHPPETSTIRRKIARVYAHQSTRE